MMATLQWLKQLSGYALASLALAVAWEVGARPDGLWHPTALAAVSLGAAAILLLQLSSAELACFGHRAEAARPEVIEKRLVELASRHKISGTRGMEAELLVARDAIEHRGLALLADGCRSAEVAASLRHLAGHLDADDLAPCRAWRAAGAALVNAGLLTTVTALVRLLLVTPAGPTPEALAGALTGTVYGLLPGLLICQPLAAERRRAASAAALARAMWIEGLTAIGDGIHPRRLADRLACVTPPQRGRWARAA
jgi:flagellar motor component MotA